MVLHEWPQLPRKYQVGEAYARHHDMHNVTDNEFTPGPRIYTFFLYLSDVEEGGETLLACSIGSSAPRGVSTPA